MYGQLDGLVQKIICLLIKHTAQQKQGFEFRLVFILCGTVFYGTVAKIIF
jgi:hypothetical protein